VSTENVEQAIQIAQETKQPIHLLVSDVVMPKMNGKELYQRMRSFHPSLKVLYISGYTDDVIAHEGVLEPGTHFLQKPFSIPDFTSKIREALGSKSE
jgi:DNA-binding NtrC family response regulator